MMNFEIILRKNIVVPAIKLLAKNNIKIDGPVPADKFLETI